MSQTLIGIDTSQTLTSTANATEGRGLAAGTRHSDAAGNDWIYVLAGAAIPQYNVVTVRGSATATTFASAAVVGGSAGPLVTGISASASIASGSYGWIMTKGVAALKVCASSTGTISGQLYACVSANSGLVQTTASGGVKLGTLYALATATTSTTASTFAVVFGNITLP